MRMRFQRFADDWKWGGAAAGVALLARLQQGILWFAAGVSKPPPDFNWFPEWVMKESQYAQIGAYKWFLDAIVIPNLTFFGYLQFFTEVVLGALLILGIFTPLVGLALTLWAFNIALGSYPVPGEQLSLLQVFVLVPLLVAAMRSGRVAGLDAWLRPRLLRSEKKWLRRLGEWGT